MNASYWEKQPTDKPWLLNGFAGTWAFSDHSLIPGELNNFIMEMFHPVERIKRIPLEDINKLMNEVWEGPGSMVKLEKLWTEKRNERLDKRTSSKDVFEQKTIDDYSEEEMREKDFELPIEPEEE